MGESEQPDVSGRKLFPSLGLEWQMEEAIHPARTQGSEKKQAEDEVCVGYNTRKTHQLLPFFHNQLLPGSSQDRAHLPVHWQGPWEMCMASFVIAERRATSWNSAGRSPPQQWERSKNYSSVPETLYSASSKLFLQLPVASWEDSPGERLLQ